MNDDRAARFYRSYKNQNRFARRIGLPLLKVAFFVLAASMALQVTLFVAMQMNERGWLAPSSLESRRLTGE